MGEDKAGYDGGTVSGEGEVFWGGHHEGSCVMFITFHLTLS